MQFTEILDQKIDQALDIVESRNAEPTPDADKEGVVESPAPEAPVEPLTDKVAEAEEAKLVTKEKAPERQHPNPARRSKDGKFTKAAESAEAVTPQISDQVANTENTAPLTAIADAVPSDLPAFWSAEMRKAAEAVPKEFLESFKRHDEQREIQYRRSTAEAQRGKAIEARMYEGYAPEEVTRHRAELAANGIKDEVEELHRYRAYDRLIKSDVKGYAAHLLQINGIHPRELLQGDAQPSAPNNFDPTEITRQAEDAAKKTITDWETKQSQAQIAQELQGFKAGKDSFGQVRQPFFDAYEYQIASLVPAARQDYPNATRTELISHAYEAWMNHIRNLHGVAAPKAAPVVAPKTTEQRIADAQKAKAMSGRTSGSSVNGTVAERPRLKGKNFSEQFDSAYEIATSGRAN